MANVQITCINKIPRQNRYEGITHLGNAEGRWTRAEVIAWIESKTHAFYTKQNGESSWIGVVDGPNGKYLRTYADREWNDNLLALPECR